VRTYPPYLLRSLIRFATAELAVLRKSEEELADKLETLEQTLWELKGDVAAGTHVPPGIRVLQLADNPASQWENMRKEALDGLRKENEALIKRLSVLEKQRAKAAKHAGEEIPESLVPKASWDRLEQEKAALDVALQQKEKRLTRLQQVSTTYDFSEARNLTHLLGILNEIQRIPRSDSGNRRFQTRFLR
jgi:mitotic spindle assembly checkpoint protein MAD1